MHTQLHVGQQVCIHALALRLWATSCWQAAAICCFMPNGHESFCPHLSLLKCL